MIKYNKNVLFISPNQEQLKYLQKYVNVFYMYPRHFHLTSWYIHRVPARIKHFLPTLPDKFMIPLEYMFNFPHRIKGLTFNIDPTIIDAVIIMDPTWCIFNLAPFKNAVRIYWSIDNVYETSLFHDLLQNKIENFDYIFTAHRNALSLFSELGPKTHWLPPYYDPELNSKLETKKEIDVSFVGNIYGPRRDYINFLKTHLKDLHTFFGVAYQKDMNEIYNRSKIVLNFTNRKELNFRVFEVLGSGGFLLNEFSTETQELFNGTVDLVFFHNIEELIDKIYYYLDRDSERQKIASLGHSKVEELHTLEIRIKELLKKTNII